MEQESAEILQIGKGSGDGDMACNTPNLRIAHYNGVGWIACKSVEDALELRQSSKISDGHVIMTHQPCMHGDSPMGPMVWDATHAVVHRTLQTNDAFQDLRYIVGYARPSALTLDMCRLLCLQAVYSTLLVHM